MSDNKDRNAACPCGSGKKYKKCCYVNDASKKMTAKVLSVGSGQGVDKISSFILGGAHAERAPHSDERAAAGHSHAGGAIKGRIVRASNRGV